LSYSIVTAEPNELLAPLHDRMPLIIAERDYQRRPELGDPQRPPVDLLRPFSSELTKAWRIKPHRARKSAPQSAASQKPFGTGEGGDPGRPCRRIVLLPVRKDCGKKEDKGQSNSTKHWIHPGNYMVDVVGGELRS
jgi:SOS response associated peptidase (SRAP)